MHKKGKKGYKKQILFFLFLFCLFQAAPCAALPWKILETDYLEIYYLNDEDLDSLDRHIEYGDVSSGFLGFGSSRKKGGDLKTQLAKKLDTLYTKVQRLLDMKKKTPRVRVKVFPNKKQLLNAYYRIYGKRADLRAWYIFEYNTVYLNVKDINEGMLAHELGHAVSDNYFGARPPRATAEILARYIDAHIHDEHVKAY
ncbi:MAG: hypothetical protein U9P10_10355 [Thermodesulfobacteriota bacterium]|nr:hypothetical protein [Thermodesulfobacteriota bacterium]